MCTDVLVLIFHKAAKTIPPLESPAQGGRARNHCRNNNPGPNIQPDPTNCLSSWPTGKRIEWHSGRPHLCALDSLAALSHLPSKSLCLGINKPLGSHLHDIQGSITTVLQQFTVGFAGLGQDKGVKMGRTIFGEIKARLSSLRRKRQRYTDSVAER